jgi:hypothetical protein
VLTAIPLLRTISHAYGHLLSLKAYMETSLERSEKSSKVWSELQSCGVGILDTPHSGGKDGECTVLVSGARGGCFAECEMGECEC